MKELEHSDIQIGDILIFEYPDFNWEEVENIWKNKEQKYKNQSEKLKAIGWYLIHFAIAWCDPGKNPETYKNIYHAAIWGNVDIYRASTLEQPNFQDRIVQAGTRGIDQASLKDTMKEPSVQTIYVCRHINKTKFDDFETKINTVIREYYNNTSLKYSFETAWLLSVLCSLRYNTGTLYKVLVKKYGLTKASLLILSITTLVQYYSKFHKKEMIACSPLVADIFMDAKIPLAIDTLVTTKPEDKLTLVDLDLVSWDINEKDIKLEMPFSVTNDTVVTPRQIMESQSVAIIGYLSHKK
ncbi:hypothetical protein [Polaribacter sp. Z022]|uniref:hypothetical protein n=1 Tax=Polaribacter sp. Z022 TaxID=2927125 RepID=UPI0020228A00|nr:hypothetical protein [Polaribacter sp. Z022]MCL7753650.1 hypothetical protein [Polaribacter sp. Z022]